VGLGIGVPGGAGRIRGGLESFLFEMKGERIPGDGGSADWLTATLMAGLCVRCCEAPSLQEAIR